jgi:hypothetical protein
MVQLSSRQLNIDSDLDLNEQQILQVEGITLNEPGAGTVESTITINNAGALLYENVPVISSTGKVESTAMDAVDLDSLLDMGIPVKASRTPGDVLTWSSSNGGEWILATPSGGGGGVTNPLSGTLDTGGNPIAAVTGNLSLQAQVGEIFVNSANGITLTATAPVQVNNHLQLAAGQFIRRTPTGLSPATADPYIDTNVSGSIVLGAYDGVGVPNSKFTIDVSGANAYILTPDAGTPGIGDVLTLDSDLTTIKFAPPSGGGGGTTLAALTDTAISFLFTGHGLIWNGAIWANGATVNSINYFSPNVVSSSFEPLVDAGSGAFTGKFLANSEYGAGSEPLLFEDPTNESNGILVRRIVAGSGIQLNLLGPGATAYNTAIEIENTGGGGGGGVTSVNGLTGSVTLNIGTLNDVAAGATGLNSFAYDQILVKNSSSSTWDFTSGATLFRVGIDSNGTLEVPVYSTAISAPPSSDASRVNLFYVDTGSGFYLGAKDNTGTYQIIEIF